VIQCWFEIRNVYRAVHVLRNLVDFLKSEKFLPDYIRFWRVDYSDSALSLVLCYRCSVRDV